MSLSGSLTEVQIKSLQDIGQVSAGRCATALSELMGRKIGMSVWSIKLLPFTKVAEAVGGAERCVVAIFLTVVSEAPCNLLFIFPIESAKVLAGILMECRYEDGQDIDAIGYSSLGEVGNVVTGAFINSLSEITNIDFMPSPPAIATDMAGAMIDTVLAESGKTGDEVLFMETIFTEIEEKVSGHLFLLPEEGTLEKIMEAIGVKG